MPPHKPSVPKAPQPAKVFFDPYNSSSAGHQRAENRLSGSTSWRDSRSYKLKHQFSDVSGRGGQSHFSDLAGAGSENFGKDGRKENDGWGKDAPGLREGGWQDIRGLLGGGKKRKSPSVIDETRAIKRQKSDEASTPEDDDDNQASRHIPSSSSETETFPFSSAQRPLAKSHDSTHPDSQDMEGTQPKPPPIFRGLTVYLNGSTAPLISDHRLKQLFFQHGGAASLALGRRTVTHVIIGEDCGGGLAATKIQKEVANVRGKGVKFVTAQWVLDSVDRGIRQPEGRYTPKNLRGRIGGAGQVSVRSMFGNKAAT